LKVLRHHPDKRKAQGEEIRPDDDYFTCITKAWEILGNPRNRRSFDSVDKEFDDSIPTVNEHTRSHFYEVVTALNLFCCTVELCCSVTKGTK
jgi:DnaJ family protein C protein 2